MAVVLGEADIARIAKIAVSIGIDRIFPISCFGGVLVLLGNRGKIVQSKGS
jgi:hypothetical protein